MMSRWQAKKINTRFVMAIMLLWIPAAAGMTPELAYRQAEKAEHAGQFQRAVSRYYKVFQFNDTVWSNRSAYRIAKLIQNFFETNLKPPSNWRGIALPSPFEIDPNRSTAPAIPGLTAIDHEVQLLYATLLKRTQILNLDKELLRELKALSSPASAKATAGKQLGINHPWRGHLQAGTIRLRGDYGLVLQANGSWKAITGLALRQQIQLALKQPIDTSVGAYALVAAAKLKIPLPSGAIRRALQSKLVRVRLAGIEAARMRDRAALRAYGQTLKTTATFDSLQLALFGEAERAYSPTTGAA